LNNILKDWLQKKYIPKKIYYSLHSSDSILPKAYGLPKIHKENTPLRIIVSTINTALYAVAAYLQKIISHNIPNSNSHIKNSFEFADLLSDKTLNSTDTLISLDVASLFTNVPLDLALDGVSNRWIHIEKNTSIPKNDFITVLKFILSSTFFTFNNIIYKQTFGTPMGSPLSPIIADIVMRDLEESILNRFESIIPLYYRYVDDIIMAAPIDKISLILDIFNNYHDRLKFTIEYEDNHCINFLDLSLLRIDNKIQINWFHKKTFSGRYLSFFSSHPTCHKIGVIYNIVDRVFLLSHPRFHQENLEYCIDILLENGYPLTLLFKKINDRIRTLINIKRKSFSKNVDSIATKESKKFFVIPYIKNISESITSATNNSEFTMGYRVLNKLNKFIKTHKDPNQPSGSNNVVYKIHCMDCDATYVGQTKRQLKTRLKEHMNNIKSTSTLSVISEHRLNNNHEFDWNNTEILDSEPHYHKRLISEMIHIKQQKNGINLNNDTELLDDAYYDILDKLSKL